MLTICRVSYLTGILLVWWESTKIFVERQNNNKNFDVGWVTEESTVRSELE